MLQPIYQFICQGNVSICQYLPTGSIIVSAGLMIKIQNILMLVMYIMNHSMDRIS